MVDGLGVGSNPQPPPLSEFFYVASGKLFVRHHDGTSTQLFDSKGVMKVADGGGEGFVAIRMELELPGSTMFLLDGEGRVLSRTHLELAVDAIAVRPGRPGEALMVAGPPSERTRTLMAVSGLGSGPLDFEDLVRVDRDAGPEWSQDGSEFAFPSEAGNIEVYDWSRREIYTVARNARSPTWLGPGRALCYRWGNTLYKRDLETGKETVLHRDYTGFRGLSELRGSPEGDVLLYSDSRDFTAWIGVFEIRTDRFHDILRRDGEAVGWMQRTPSPPVR